MSAINLKKISVSDRLFPQVWELREAVLRQPLGLSLKDEDLSGEQNEQIIVALSDGKVVGCVMMKDIGKNIIKLRQMAVDPTFQAKGIGAALLQEAEITAVEQGYETIQLHARISAVDFYKKCGYTVVGGEFIEVGIPHLFMEKKLNEVL